MDDTQPPSQDPTSQDQATPGAEPATELIRSRLDQLYQTYQAQHPLDTRDTLTERFFKHHRHVHPDQQVAWQQFYASLSDEEKNRLWAEHQTTGQSEQKHQPHTPFGTFGMPGSQAIPEATPVAKPTQPAALGTLAQLKGHLLKKAKERLKEQPIKTRLRPWVMAFAVGGAVLGLNYNNLVIAQIKQFVSPGDSLRSPIIVDPNSQAKIGRETRLIIPKINVDVPIVLDEQSVQESKLQKALERGVVHYANSALPGEGGNGVIVGHSSNNFFNGGRYKFAFVLLERLNEGDTFMINYKSKRYIYRVSKEKVVQPDDFSLLQETAKPTMTLLTCTPPGTSWRRLIIQGQQISPAPSSNLPSSHRVDTSKAKQVPGNSVSLFQRIRNFIFSRD